MVVCCTLSFLEIQSNLNINFKILISDAHFQSHGKPSQLQLEQERIQRELRQEKEHTASLSSEKEKLEECLKSTKLR